MDTNFSQSLTDHAGLGLDGEDDCDELRQRGGCKKKRLSVQQVRSLEMNFEIENKLEPERKMQIAQELGLQPRQVAIWFQNRRARWKTKQLEREYGLLKLNYESLKSNFDVVQRENQKLSAQVSSLKERLEETQEQKADDNGQGSEAKPMQKKANNNNANKANGIEMCESEGSSGILNDQCEMNRRNSPSPINSYVTGYNNNSVVPTSHEDFKAKASVTQQNCYENQNVNHQNLLHHEEQPSCNLFNMVDNPAAFTFPWWEWS